MFEFSSLIRARRISKGLSLDDVAKKVGVESESLRQYEMGSRIPRADAAVRIAKFLKFSLNGASFSNPPACMPEHVQRLILTEQRKISKYEQRILAGRAKIERLSTMNHNGARNGI